MRLGINNNGTKFGAETMPVSLIDLFKRNQMA